MTTRPRVLAAMAHPDDIEFLCAGTLRLLVERGWELQCVTLSGGDVGAPTGTREAIRETRLAEAENAAHALGGSYAWAGLDDLAIHYSPDQLVKVTDTLRRFSPNVVITHSPDCYMLDHEETAKLVRMACFAAGIPLFPTSAAPTGTGVPALYYADAFEGKDKFGRPVAADFWIDVTSVFGARQAALACHVSQREWLRAHHGVDDYLRVNERFAREHGERCGATYAEGFRQHLGHGYPQEDVLGATLPHLRRTASGPIPS
ncbi:MAG: PIG-L family deacetylase [Gemmatimonadetes bacterium]|nr:PIG-L family deacetylase [Gemmatimonadota bacterium]